jgi:hypothetical protein
VLGSTEEPALLTGMAPGPSCRHACRRVSAQSSARELTPCGGPPARPFLAARPAITSGPLNDGRGISYGLQDRKPRRTELRKGCFRARRCRAMMAPQRRCQGLNATNIGSPVTAFARPRNLGSSLVACAVRTSEALPEPLQSKTRRRLLRSQGFGHGDSPGGQVRTNASAPAEPSASSRQRNNDLSACRDGTSPHRVN